MTIDRLEAIEGWQQWLHRQGYPSFPLFGITNGQCRCNAGPDCPSPGKHPKIKGWRTIERFVAAGVMDNVGVSTDRLVVVDIDSGFDIPDDLPETLTISTGRGLHLWYAANPGHQIGNAAGWRPKIDIRSYGGLVAAPPSRHVSGAVYDWYAGNIIRPVPQVVLDSYTARQQRQRRAPVTEIGSETSTLMQPLADALVQQMRDAQPGERNPTLFRIACRFFEQAATGWMGEDTLRLIFEAATEAGLSPTEVAATIESASRSLSR